MSGGEEARAGDLSGARVLVAEDDVALRQLFAAQLRQAGFAVEEAERGDQAVALFEQSPPALVLLDVMMPQMDGIEACRRIKATALGARTPVVFMTAAHDAKTHQAAIEAGADDFLPKPLSAHALLIRVRSLLKLKRADDEAQQHLALIALQRDELLSLQERNAALMRVLVHDLKNPLASLAINARYMLQQHELVLDAREACVDIAEATDAIQRMIMNLNDLARSERGKLAVQKTEFSTKDLLDAVRSAPSYGARPRLVIRNLAEDARLTADREMMVRVLDGLVDNGLRHSSESTQVDLTCARDDGGALEFRVTDRGAQVPPAWQARLFDSPPPGASDEKNPREGRGLVLFFCRLAVEANGGRIFAQNLPEGVCFCVRMPLLRA